MTSVLEYVQDSVFKRIPAFYKLYAVLAVVLLSQNRATSQREISSASLPAKQCVLRLHRLERTEGTGETAAKKGRWPSSQQCTTSVDGS